MEQITFLQIVTFWRWQILRGLMNESGWCSIHHSAASSWDTAEGIRVFVAPEPLSLLSLYWHCCYASNSHCLSWKKYHHLYLEMKLFFLRFRWGKMCDVSFEDQYNKFVALFCWNFDVFNTDLVKHQVHKRNANFKVDLLSSPLLWLQLSTLTALCTVVPHKNICKV